jgi:aryl-alcohol dehydrogenase-like predicted oxidoreductase
MSLASLVLGTARWGWGVNKAQAFEMMSIFEDFGGTLVDSATNYPINGETESNGLALRWLAEWFQVKPDSRSKVLVKVGSVDNSGSSASDLSETRLSKVYAQLMEDFGPERLHGLGVHWDNRRRLNGDVSEDVLGTIRFLRSIFSQGLNVGLSGIKAPDLYASVAPELADKWIIQVKENISDKSSREQYSAVFARAHYLAYGINFGGSNPASRGANAQSKVSKLKTEIQKSQILGNLAQASKKWPYPNSVYQLALLYAHRESGLSGVILGSRTSDQLIDSLKFAQGLNEN